MKRIDLNTLSPQPVSHNPRITKRVMLATGDLAHLSQFAQAIFPAGESVPAHCHADMAEVFFIESGSGLMRIEDIEYPLTAGQCLLVQAGERHELINSGDTDLVIRSHLKIAVLADTALKMNSKCSFTLCKLRFFVHFCLVSPALANFEMASSYFGILSE